MKKIILTKNSEETQKLGEKLARSDPVQGRTLQGGRIIALYGELGSGKTTFVQGLAKGLGIKNKIISPTFIIVKSYEISIKYQVSGIKYFYHIDLYRIDDKNNFKEIGINEIISDPRNIVAIEWAEKIKSMLPKDRVDIYFEYLNEGKRKIKIINTNILV